MTTANVLLGAGGVLLTIAVAAIRDSFRYRAGRSASRALRDAQRLPTGKERLP